MTSYAEGRETGEMQESEMRRARNWGIVLGILIYIILLFLLFQAAGLLVPPHELPLDNPVIGWIVYGSLVLCIFAGQYFLCGRHCEEMKRARDRATLAGLSAGFFIWLAITAKALSMGFAFPRYPNILAGYLVFVPFIMAVGWHFEQRWSRDMLILLAVSLFICACLAVVIL